MHMRYGIPLSLVCAASLLAKEQEAIHFFGWSSRPPDMAAKADQITRRELERSPKLALLPLDSIDLLQRKGILSKEPPTSAQALDVARSVQRRRVVWAYLDRMDGEVSRIWWRPLWANRKWTARADLFVYDSSRNEVRHETLKASHKTYLGFSGFTDEELMPISSHERFTESEILLRDLAEQVRDEVK